MEYINTGELFKYTFVEDNVILSEDVKTIGRMVFYGSDLKTVRIPKTVTAVLFRAFFDCRNLRSVVIPDNVTVIEEEAFGYGMNGKIEDFSILGKKDSEAQRYANKNGFTFYEVKNFGF